MLKEKGVYLLLLRDKVKRELVKLEKTRHYRRRYFRANAMVKPSCSSTQR